MHKQLLAIMVATMLALAMAFIGPTSIAIAQEEEPKPETTVEEVIEIFNDGVSDAVGDIIADNPELSDAIAETAGEIAATDEVKPEISIAVNELINEVSDADAPTDVIVTLDPDLTQPEVLMTISSLNDTQILESAVTNVVTLEVIATNTDFIEASNVLLCNAVNDILVNGTDIDVALEDLPGDIADVAEAEITPGEVAVAIDNVEPTEVIADIESGDVDLGEAVEDATADELVVEITPAPEPEPTPDPTPGPSENSVQAQLDVIRSDIAELQAGQNVTNDLLADIKALLETLTQG